jgi:hypothetical protein
MGSSGKSKVESRPRPVEPLWVDCLRRTWLAIRNTISASASIQMCTSHLTGVRLTIEPYQAMGMLTRGLRSLAMSDTDLGVLIASHASRFDLLVIKAAARAILGQLEIFEAAHARSFAAPTYAGVELQEVTT